MNGWMYDTMAYNGCVRIKNPKPELLGTMVFESLSGRCQVETSTFFQCFTRQNAPLVGVDGH